MMIKPQYRTGLLLISTLRSAADHTEKEAHKTSTAVSNTRRNTEPAQMTLYNMRICPPPPPQNRNMRDNNTITNFLGSSQAIQ